MIGIAGARARHWVCLDVGETLVDETRIMSLWARELGVPALTFGAALGGAIVRGRPHQQVFALLGAEDWADREPRVQAAYGGFRDEDLYADALPGLRSLADAGYRVAVVANQPACRHAELEALGVRPEVMAMSEAMGVAKPDRGFFRRALRLMGLPDPADVAYVGDRVDNDVLPAAAAGLRTVWIRRGPWGLLQRAPATPPDLEVRSLVGLVERLDDLWALR